MKIKAVCEETGLSDRTVRYYIEEGLISPSYTENYLGRKTFDFSEKDICELNDIAVLRSFGFTIGEIREIIADAAKSGAITDAVRKRCEKEASEAQKRLYALSQIDTSNTYTLSELAAALSKSALALPKPEDKTKMIAVKTLLAALKSALIFTIVWSPAAVGILGLINALRKYCYPVFDTTGIALLGVSFLPSIAVIFLSKINLRRKKAARLKQAVVLVLLCYCVFNIPISFFASYFEVVPCSETTDIKHYRDFDSGCIVNRDSLFQQIFPAWPRYFKNVQGTDGEFHVIDLNAKYYYHFESFLDYTYDVYAEWPLEEDKFYVETERVRAVFEKEAEATSHYDFDELKKGRFDCIILYDGSSKPFSKETGNYDIYIFAYNENEKTVRYIVCSSLQEGTCQPCYLNLDW